MTFKKLAAYLIALVAIAVFVISIFGIVKKYGDITTNYVNPAVEMNTDVDFGYATSMILAAPEGTEWTVDQLRKAQQIVCKRIETMGFVDYNTWCDFEQRQILFEFANNAHTYNNLNWIVTNIGSQGVVYAQHGSADATDSSQWIFDNSQIRKFRISYDQSTYQYNIEVFLNSEGKAKLKEQTTALLAEATEGVKVYLSLWTGGESIGTVEVNKAIKNGVITFAASYQLQTQINNASIYMSAAPLEADLELSSLSLDTALFGETAIRNIALGLACGIAAAIIYLIFRFGFSGLSAGIMAIGTIGTTMFFLTGFMSTRYMMITVSVLAAFILSVLIVLECAVRDGNALKQKLKNHSVERSIKEAYKATFPKSAIIVASAAALALVMTLCGKNDAICNLLYRVGMQSTMIHAIGSFGTVLFIGVVAGFVWNILLNRLVVKSFALSIQKPALFGGTHHEE